MGEVAAAAAGMTQQLQGQWAEPSLLPRVTKLAELRGDVRDAAGWLLDPTEYRSATDHVVAAFVLELRSRIRAFYRGRGAPIRLLFAPTSLARIDRQLAESIPPACEAWRRFKEDAERGGSSTRQAAVVFARTIPRIFSLIREMCRNRGTGFAYSVVRGGGTVRSMRVMPLLEPSPTELRELHSWFATDRVAKDPAATAWKRLARWRQATWRVRMNFPLGSEPYKGGADATAVGSRLALRFAKSKAVNFLTPRALAAVKDRLARPEEHQMLSEARLWADLLSSMPLCFNLFGDVSAPIAAARAVTAWWPEAPRGAVELRFEHSPGRRDPGFLGNRSAFDAAFEIALEQDKRAIIGVETKYHEHAKAEPAPPKARLGRYKEVTEASGAFLPGWESRLVGTDLQQIWLDHLLLLSMLQHPSRRWNWGRFVLVYPAENPSFASAAKRYRSALGDSSTFEARTIEELVATPGALPVETVRLFRKRYL